MKKVELVVFDMAGTTVEDAGNVATCFLNAFTKEKIEIPPMKINKVMGFRKKEAIRMLLKKFHPVNGNEEELVNKIHTSFTRSMIRHYQTSSTLRPLPFAEETFALLRKKGIQTALNTGFHKEITNAILQRLNWEHEVVDAVISSDEVEEGRPSPAMIFELMKRLNIGDAVSVAKVGDTAVDILEGRNAGCGLVIGITSGSYNRKELEDCIPDHIIDNLQELPELIK